MAEKPPAPEIQALILRASIARAHLGNSVDSLRGRLNAKSLLNESIRSHPGLWLAGASATGLLASRVLLPRRRKPARPKKNSHPVLSLILRMASNAIMPAVKIWLLAQIKSYLARRAQGGQNPFSH